MDVFFLGITRSLPGGTPALPVIGTGDIAPPFFLGVVVKYPPGNDHISPQKMALLSRWFSQLPFWWDMWSFPGGYIYISPQWKPENFFLAIFCRFFFFSMAPFLNDLFCLGPTGRTFHKNFQMGSQVSSMIHPFQSHFLKFPFRWWTKKNPIELVDTFHTFGTSYWLLLLLLLLL